MSMSLCFLCGLEWGKAVKIYMNEVKCNDFIKNNSSFLVQRTPNVLMDFVHEDYHVIIFEYFEISKEIGEADLEKALCEFLYEYSRIGIIHQDLKLSNLTVHNGRYCIIDYGYSICPNSDHVRISRNNYIKNISDTAKAVLGDTDFYYDDAIATGVKGVDRNEINFIVGKEDRYFLKLAGNIYEYRLERLTGRSVCLLHKCVGINRTA